MMFKRLINTNLIGSVAQYANNKKNLKGLSLINRQYKTQILAFKTKIT